MGFNPSIVFSIFFSPVLNVNPFLLSFVPQVNQDLLISKKTETFNILPRSRMLSLNISEMLAGVSSSAVLFCESLKTFFLFPHLRHGEGSSPAMFSISKAYKNDQSFLALGRPLTWFWPHSIDSLCYGKTGLETKGPGKASSTKLSPMISQTGDSFDHLIHLQVA